MLSLFSISLEEKQTDLTQYRENLRDLTVKIEKEIIGCKQKSLFSLNKTLNPQELLNALHLSLQQLKKFFEKKSDAGFNKSEKEELKKLKELVEKSLANLKNPIAPVVNSELEKAYQNYLQQFQETLESEVELPNTYRAASS